jgi:hypothetical protein
VSANLTGAPSWAFAMIGIVGERGREGQRVRRLVSLGRFWARMLPMPSIPRALQVLLAFALLWFTASGCSTSTSRQSDADSLNSMVGIATRADIIQQIGPPQQTMKVDGDEFFIYLRAVRDPISGLGQSLSSMSAGYQGRAYTPPPGPQQTYILRFDGVTGKLKGWNVR